MGTQYTLPFLHYGFLSLTSTNSELHIVLQYLTSVRYYLTTLFQLQWVIQFKCTAKCLEILRKTKICHSVGSSSSTIHTWCLPAVGRYGGYILHSEVFLLLRALVQNLCSVCCLALQNVVAGMSRCPDASHLFI